MAAVDSRADPSTNGQPVEKAAPTGEIGASGLEVLSGRPTDDYEHGRLRGRRAARAFREMLDNDPIVGAILFAIGMVLRGKEWHAVPQDEDCADCQRWAEFLDTCLDDMSFTWPQTVDAILSFLPYGWSFLEVVYKTRGGDVADPTSASKHDDGLVGWRKLALRAQESLVEWTWDPKGGLQAMVQNVGGVPTPIPIEKALLFRTTVARGNPEGRSVLRNAFRAYRRKKRIEEIEGVGIERDLAGLPVAHVPPEYLDANATNEQKQALDAVKRIVTNIRRDEQEGVVFPLAYDENGHETWKLELLSTGGRRQFDTDAIVARYEQRIAMVVLADLILLGHEKIGSYGLGVSKLELFLRALEAWLDEVAAVMNRFGVVRLMRLNGVGPEHWPTLAHDEVGETDLEAIAAILKEYTSAGGALDEALDAFLREKFGWPAAEPEPTEV